jgi:serine protease Do
VSHAGATHSRWTRGAADRAAFRFPGLALALALARGRVIAALPLAVLTAALLAAPSAAPSAEGKRAPASRQEITLSFAPLVKRVSPAVVNIYTKVVFKEQPVSPLFNDPFFRRFFGESFGAPRERILGALGSGVIVREDGYIATNYHVIEKAQEITIVLSDRREFPAELVLSDKRTDLAVLRIDAGGETLPYLELRDSDDIEVGDLVLAIGNPFGFEQSVSSGIISALARTSSDITDLKFFIQTDAAINPGNSGGALVTMDGRLVGINTWIHSKSGSSAGVGFAVPANMVRAVIKAALTDGKLHRPWLGASGQNVTAEIAASLGLAKVGGVILSEMHPRSPARPAGLRAGDIVTEVNGREVLDGEGLRFRLATLEVGGTAKLTYLRKGKARVATIRLVAPPEDPPSDVSRLKGKHPFSGATVANLSPALSDQIGLRGFDSGVIVLAVVRGSPASFLQIEVGDILISVNGSEISSVADLKRIVARKARAWKVSIRRGRQVFTVTFRS